MLAKGGDKIFLSCVADGDKFLPHSFVTGKKIVPPLKIALSLRVVEKEIRAGKITVIGNHEDG